MKSNLPIWLLVMASALLSSCLSLAGGGEHGTDTPNALTVAVKDQKGSPMALQLVRATIQAPEKAEEFSEGYTNAQGQWTLNVAPDAKVYFSTSLIDGKTLYFGSAQASHGQTGPITLAVTESKPMTASLAQVPDSINFLQYLEIPQDSSTDPSSLDYDTASIIRWFQQAKSEKYHGVSWALAGNSQWFSNPVLDSSIWKVRMRWFFQKAASLNLYVHLVEIRKDPQGTHHEYLQEWKNEDWAKYTHYNWVALPTISSATCSDACLLGLKSIEIVDDLAEALNFLDGNCKNMGHAIATWKSSSGYLRAGMGLQRAEPFSTLKCLDDWSPYPYQRPDFAVIGSGLDLNALKYSAETLHPRVPVFLRWQLQREPTSAEIQRIKELNYYGVMIPGRIPLTP
jgi:hypothetical protein